VKIGYFDIEIYDEYGRDVWAQEKYLVHGYEAVMWTSDLEGAMKFLEESVENQEKERDSMGEKPKTYAEALPDYIAESGAKIEDYGDFVPFDFHKVETLSTGAALIDGSWIPYSIMAVGISGEIFIREWKLKQL